MKRKQIILLNIYLLMSIVICGQDTIQKQKIMSVSTNYIQMRINEYNIYLEYRINYQHSIGCEFGKIYYNREFDPWKISPSQNKFPGTVYDGLGLRIYLKRYSLKNPTKYWNFIVPVKIMSYDSLEFTDMYNGESDWAKYTRSENAFLVGLDIYRGHEFDIFHQIIMFDIFYGIGFRIRHREYTTHISLRNGSIYGIPKPPIGSFKINQFLPTINIGIKVGFNILKKRTNSTL